MYRKKKKEPSLPRYMARGLGYEFKALGKMGFSEAIKSIDSVTGNTKKCACGSRK